MSLAVICSRRKLAPQHFRLSDTQATYHDHCISRLLNTSDLPTRKPLIMTVAFLASSTPSHLPTRKPLITTVAFLASSTAQVFRHASHLSRPLYFSPPQHFRSSDTQATYHDRCISRPSTCSTISLGSSMSRTADPQGGGIFEDGCLALSHASLDNVSHKFMNCERTEQMSQV